jgi:hypothetical protein
VPESFRSRLEQRLAQTAQGTSEDLWRYREAASVLVSFDYDSLQPLGDVSPSSTAKTELLADCDVEYLTAGTPRWSLRTPVRQTALHRLLEKQAVGDALASNPNKQESFAQKLLERLLKNYQAPSTVVRANASFGSPDENQALLKVVTWLNGVPEFKGKLPQVGEVQARIARDHLLEPFRHLVGGHFAGRRSELEQLADYVGIHDAYSVSEKFQRAIERIRSIHDRPPLFFNGPGGAGKSTLIAKFILDHATVEQSSRFPFAYLDFDRVGLIAEEPITLLFDVMRQLAIQFPAVQEQYLFLAQEWSSRLTEQTRAAIEGEDSAKIDPKSVRLENRESFISEFADFVKSLKKEEQPLLLVLDTFEEIQFRSTAFTDEIFDFLEDLQQRVPRLRTVLSGRVDIQSERYEVKRVLLGDFDNDAAVSYLAGRELTDPQVAQRIYDLVGGSPLVLRLAADLAKLDKVNEKGVEGLDSWFSNFQKESIQAVLYKRILSHVYNKRIEEIAYPGLVLRIFTPEVLLEILGPACGVPIASIGDARDLVTKMKERLSTILVPAGSDDEVLVHRPDMRSILLSDLKITAETKPEIGQKLTKIHQGAIAFYSKFSTPAQRAEEIYHRLALNIDRSALSTRWMDGLGPYLGSSIRELPPASQVYLAARLGLELPDALWKSAEDEDWILYASRLVDQTLTLQKPMEALEVIRQRKHLWTSDKFRPVLNNVADAIFSDYARQYEQIRKTYKGGNQRTGMMNSLVAQIRSTATELPIDSYAQEFFAQRGPGKRLVALAIAYARPSPKDMRLAIAGIKNAISPFEQFHALRLATLLFDQSTAAQRRSLLQALRIQEGIPIDETDPSRFVLKNDLLGRLSKVTIFSIDLIPARTGDCLILHYGSADNPRLVLIDGGPKGVYRPYLKPRLEQIKAARNLGKSEPLLLDLVMISHSDNDHIQGLLDLTRELIELQMDQRPEFLRITELWHNSFDNIVGDTTTALTNAMRNKFGQAVSAGDSFYFTLNSEISEDTSARPLDSIRDKDVFANLQVFAGINQNAQFRHDAELLGVQRNVEFDGTLIVARPKGKRIDVGGGLKFTVIGPMLSELTAFQKRHDARLKNLGTSGLTSDEELSAYVDASIPSLSSIVVLAEVNKKQMLLTGDARGDLILEGLELAGLVKRDAKIHVDVLKVPRHGNARNLPYDFFDRVTADHYIISGNGEHGDPDRELFEMLIDARKTDNYAIHLTYPIAEIDGARKLHWEKELAREHRQEKPRRRMKPDWSPRSHSLQALLEKNPEFARKIRTVEDRQPYVINLLNEVEF